MHCPDSLESLADLDEALQELESAEDFLYFFQLEFDPQVVQVNRLHILQRFHNYLAARPLPDELEARFVRYGELLELAYQSFVNSSARQEKVLKVFKRAEPGSGFVGLGAIGGLK